MVTLLGFDACPSVKQRFRNGRIAVKARFDQRSSVVVIRDIDVSLSYVQQKDYK